VILVNGRVVADAALAELAVASATTLALSHRVDGVEAALRAETGVGRVQSQAHPDGTVSYTIWPRGQADDLGPTLFRCAAAHGWPVCELKRQVRSLESVFAELTLVDVPTGWRDSGVEA